MNRINLSTLLLPVHFLLILFTIVGSIYVVTIHQTDWLIAFLTVPTINLLLIPITNRAEKFDPTHPIFLILISLIIGTVLRSFFIISPLQSSTKFLMLLGSPPTILLKGIFCIYLGLLSFVIGYMYPVKPLSDWSNKKIYKSEISLKKFIPVTLFIVIASVLMAAVYFKNVGVNFSSITNISQKRFYKTDEGDYAALGYETLVMGLILPIFYILLMHMIQNKKRFLSPLGVFLFFLGFLNVAYAFIQSSRTTALYVLINSGLLLYYVKGRLKWKQLIPVFVTTAFLLVIMTVLRHIGNKVETTVSSNDTNPLIIMVSGLNFLGVDKTSQIIDKVPERMNYQFGTTLFLWVIAPIPRTMWPNKPEISIGRPIGEYIYEKRTDETAAGGVTPGFIGELYLDFGYLGVVAGMFIFGLTIKLFYNAFKKVRAISIYGMVIYLTVFIPFELNLIGGDLSRMIINALMMIIPLYIILRISQSSIKKV